MSTKWKYATIPAANRLTMLRDGNEELYNEEIARTKDAISNRLAAGLGVDEQMKWADTVSYNYNLSKAKNMGINAERVAKSGYADRLFGDMTESVTKDKVSGTKKPVSLTDGKYYESYENMTRDRLASSVVDSYIGGINRRAAQLQASYGEYVKELDAEYEKKVRDAAREYRKSEKLAEEALTNSGASAVGGRTLTEKLKQKDMFLDHVAELRKEKESYISAAQNSLRDKLYSMSEAAMSGISDEYYRYNNLLATEKDTEYQKQRDAAEDDKWWQSFMLDKDEAVLAAYERALEREGENARFAAEMGLARDELDFEKSKQSVSYEQWLKEFEAQKLLDENNVRLSDRELDLRQAENAAEYERWRREFEYGKEQDSAQLAADAERYSNELAFDSEKFEYQKEKDAKSDGSKASDKDEKEKNVGTSSGSVYDEALQQAKNYAAALVRNERNGSFEKKYTDREILEWIRSLGLTDAEKIAICSEIGIEYTE